MLTIGSMSWLVLSQDESLNDRHMKLLCEQHHQARHDALTGLNHRVALESILDQSIADTVREDLVLAVFLLDLDRFKNINDSLGHNAGDRLLIEVATRLQGCVRGADTVARLSGDEFVVLLPRLASPDVTTIAGKLVEALSAPYTIGDRELRITPSIGISLCPRDAQDVETLIKYADTAMYAAKAKGGGRFQYFAPEMNQAATERLLIECRLREAMDQGLLALHYQPKIDMAGRLTGLEALLRWEAEGASSMLPAQFIAIAEESGLIDEVGDWVIATVCRQLRAWLDDGIPAHVVAKWIGHSVKVQNDNYAQVDDHHFDQFNASAREAAKIAECATETESDDENEKVAHQVAHAGSTQQTQSEASAKKKPRKTGVLRGSSQSVASLRCDLVPEAGVEPAHGITHTGF
ncbi:MAG TPA: diguanylate cyclase [Thauera sp.]|nr:diguanylate cyclase [Thauera sp.]